MARFRSLAKSAKPFGILTPWSLGDVVDRFTDILRKSKDCNVNSASDAIKFSDAPMEVRALNTIQKLQLGQLTIFHGKSPLSMGKSTISMAIVSLPEGMSIARNQFESGLSTLSQSAVAGSTCRAEVTYPCSAIKLMGLCWSGILLAQSGMQKNTVKIPKWV